jgi:hypothetical protein
MHIVYIYREREGEIEIYTPNFNVDSAWIGLEWGMDIIGGPGDFLKRCNLI